MSHPQRKPSNTPEELRLQQSKKIMDQVKLLGMNLTKLRRIIKESKNVIYPSIKFFGTAFICYQLLKMRNERARHRNYEFGDYLAGAEENKLYISHPEE